MTSPMMRVSMPWQNSVRISEMVVANNNKTFGELKGDSFCAECADAMDRFGDFEGVVRGEEGDRGKDVGVFGDGGRDVV